MTDFQNRLEILLGGCREPIPPRFYRTFEGRPFDACTYCHAPLLAAGKTYTISKLYNGDQLQVEIAICRSCQAQLKEGYSRESLDALRAIYSEIYLQRRLDILYHTAASEDRAARMLAQCALCSAPRDGLGAFFEYALCQGDELVYYTHPSMMCEQCALHVHSSLSEQTKEHKRRFVQEQFGFPPPDSGVEAERVRLWMVG
jgi:hypothetical protein